MSDSPNVATLHIGGRPVKVQIDRGPGEPWPEVLLHLGVPFVPVDKAGSYRVAGWRPTTGTVRG